MTTKPAQPCVPPTGGVTLGLSPPRSMRWISWSLGVALLAVVIIAARHFSEARDFARLTEQAEPWWLALAVLLQAGTYLAQGQVFCTVARAGGFTLPLATACRLSMAKLFVDQALPSAGLSGTVVLASGLQRHRMPRTLVATAVVVDLTSYYVAFVLALGVALTLSAAWGEATPLIVLVAVVFLTFAVALSGLVLVLAGRGGRVIPRGLTRVAIIRAALDFVREADPSLARAPSLLARTSAYQLAIVLFDASTLWVLIQSLGGHGSPGGVFASFMISTLLRTVGIIPGGLGTFEAASVLALRMIGVPVAIALAATLLFRGLSFWLPMLPGFWFSRRELGGHSAVVSNADAAAEPDLPLEALLARLKTTWEGLSHVEAARRLQIGGPNEPASTAGGSRILELVRASTNPLVVILLVAGIASAFLGEVTDAAIIAGIVLSSAAINFSQTYRSERAVKRLQAQITPTATARRDGVWIEVPRQQIVAGDLIRLSAGDLVPADARLVDARDLHVQQAALTGESLPAEKSSTRDALTSSGPDSPALVFLGTSIVSGTATAIVFAAGRDTAYGDIIERLAARPEETELERSTRRFGVLILETVMFLVFFILVVNVTLGRDALESLLFSVALAVGLTPELLPMIVTVTLAQGAVRMARDKVIVKHLASIHILGSIDVLCCDKTGTLTAGSVSLDAALGPFGAPDERALCLGAVNARLESGIKSPLDAAILAQPPPGTDRFSKTDELPFDFERRRLSVVVEHDDERLMITKGAPESVLDVCVEYEVNGERHTLDEASKARCLTIFREASARGLRILAVAYRSVDSPRGLTSSDERALIFVGFLTFADHLLEGVPASLAALGQDGVEVKILTGDNELVTRHLCEQVGIRADRIVLGEEIQRMDEGALWHVASEARVFARVSPAQKHRIIRALRAHGHVVGFLGDGINDAPSLHGADVGISVAGAADVAREASDIILLEHNLAVLHAGIITGRRAFGNVFKYLLMGTSSNFGNMLSMAGAALFLPFLPMQPTQILLNNLLYDVAQLTIPTDTVDATYIERPQRWDISAIRRFMVSLGPVSSAFDFLTFWALLAFFRFGESAFQTGWFIESLSTQVLVLFVIRTIGRPWSTPPSIPLVITALAIVILGIVLPYSPAASPLGMVPLPATFLAFVAVVVPCYLLLVEHLKRRLMRRLFERPASGRELRDGA